MGKYRQYTPDFKAQAVGLALERDNISGAAKDLGVPNTTLRKWIDAYEGDKGTSPDTHVTLEP